MVSTSFANAFYIKLGRGGKYESDSIQTGKLRFGWDLQSVADINNGNWARIEQQLREEHRGRPRQVATADLHRLQHIAQSGPDDVWVTFHQAKLWWARLDSSPTKEDSLSKFRNTAQPWSDRSGDGRLLTTNDLPGRIAQIQAFRATACRVNCPELLQRVLQGTRSSLASSIAAQRGCLAKQLTEAIKELHWKDFETLVDLVFRHAGWIRVSVLGQQAKGYDLELREPITGDRYVVQVKSRASLQDLHTTISGFSAKDYRRVFFVVHSPEADLETAVEVPDHMELVPPLRLAERAIDAGLATWLENKVS